MLPDLLRQRIEYVGRDGERYLEDEATRHDQVLESRSRADDRPTEVRYGTGQAHGAAVRVGVKAIVGAADKQILAEGDWAVRLK